MILIQSKEDLENTTEQVIDWLDFYGQQWQRLNGEDLLHGERLKLTIPASDLLLNGESIPVAEIRVVWHRRGGAYKVDLPAASTALYRELLGYLKAEARALRGSVVGSLPGALHLDHPDVIGLNKLDVLYQALQLGLSVPRSLVTNCREEARAFAESCSGGIIAKSLYEAHDFSVDGHRYVLTTRQLQPADLPEVFYPTLLQEELRKEYELRVFCLEDELYAMAIFSQLDERTKVDFRNYNVNRPNRVVPYALPEIVGQRLRQLLRRLRLTSGSVDMVRTQAGEYVFLEINPTGQFGMVSGPCNYHLEQRMAEFLSKKHDEHSLPGASPGNCV